MNELIKIKQLPVLEEQFKKLGEEIDIELENVNNLIVNDETYKGVKKIRANFNKQAEEYATQFKKAEKSILEPWEQVKKTYKENVVLKYSAADQTLKNKINSIENELKEAKRKELKAFFEKCKEENNIDFVEFSDIGLNINMSTSLKKLKEQIIAFVDKINNDLQTISNLEYKIEIMVEYKRTLDINKSILKAKERIEEIQKEKERIEEIQKEKEIYEDVQKLKYQIDKKETPTLDLKENEETKEIVLKINTTESKEIFLFNFLKEYDYNFKEEKQWWE